MQRKKYDKDIRLYRGTKKKIKYTWRQFNKDVKGIKNTIKHIKIEGVYGVPRGGLILAVVLSHALEVPLILDPNKINERTIVVDDIIDKGKTLQKLLEKRDYLATVVLWWNRDACIDPTVWAKEKKEKWVVFPWETLTSSKYDNN